MSEGRESWASEDPWLSLLEPRKPSPLTRCPSQAVCDGQAPGQGGGQRDRPRTHPASPSPHAAGQTHWTGATPRTVPAGGAWASALWAALPTWPAPARYPHGSHSKCRFSITHRGARRDRHTCDHVFPGTAEIQPQSAAAAPLGRPRSTGPSARRPASALSPGDSPRSQSDGVPGPAGPQATGVHGPACGQTHCSPS